MPDIKVPVKKSLQSRLDEALRQTNVSLMPEESEPKKVKKPATSKESIPVLTLRLQAEDLVRHISELQEAERDIRNLIDPVMEKLRGVLTEAGFKKGVFTVDDIRVDRRSISNCTINMPKLLGYGLDAGMISDCLEMKTEDSIQISVEGE